MNWAEQETLTEGTMRGVVLGREAPSATEAWGPVLSPAGDRIAFVPNASGNDEIWIVNRDGSGLKRLTAINTAYNAREIGKDTFLPEVNGHPSWSPNGTKIIFWANRTGHRQFWIMNVDGSNARRLISNTYDDRTYARRIIDD